MDAPGVPLPSVEGVLLGLDRGLGEYRVAVAELRWAPGGNPDVLEAQELRVPRERVAFYEVVR